MYLKLFTFYHYINLPTSPIDPAAGEVYEDEDEEDGQTDQDEDEGEGHGLGGRQLDQLPALSRHAAATTTWTCRVTKSSKVFDAVGATNLLDLRVRI